MTAFLVISSLALHYLGGRMLFMELRTPEAHKQPFTVEELL